MCGIIGYTGSLDAKNVLLEGLKSLEYRGYDSAGVCFFNDKNNIEIIKSIGKVEILKNLVDKNKSITHCGMGHTRWATHGGVTNENAHPHNAGNVYMIHNGIIENFMQLKEKYNITHTIGSTDTEIAAIVLNHIYNENEKDPLISINKFLKEITGTYSLCIMFDDKPGEIYATRKVSPLVATNNGQGSIIASDLTALIPYTKEYLIIPEYKIIRMTAYNIKAYELDTLKRTDIEYTTLNWDISSAIKGNYKHYMLKEINEQPEALINTIMPYLKNDIPDFSDENINDDILKNIDSIQVVACGTARHAGLVACNLFSPILKMPINTYVASEYRYSEPMVDERTLFISVSQSGETVDTIASLELAKSMKAKTLAVVNVKGSTIARESDYCLYTNAGPEIAVASTKAYTVQIALLYLLFAKIAYLNNKYSLEDLKNFTNELLSMSNVIRETINNTEEKVKEVAQFLKDKNDCFYIGRLLDYISSLEGALKLKEISYIHTDAYAAGELKHGTIALISKGVPVIAIDTNEKITSKLLSNVQEVKARNASIILIINEKFAYDKNLVDFVIPIKNVDYKFAIFPVSIVTQLIAYHTSLEKGLDVDKPRNLAKSVTVE